MKYLCKLYNRKGNYEQTLEYDYLPDRIRVPKMSKLDISYPTAGIENFNPTVITSVDYRVIYRGKIINSEIAEYDFHETGGPRTPIEVLEDFLKE